MNKGLKLLSDYVFNKNYAQTKPDGTKESWDESIDRIYNMHRNFLISKGYKPELFDAKLEEAKKYEKKKYFLSSQRSRQFGSPNFNEGVLANHSKLYNCSYTIIDRPRVFAEVMYELLCGTGVGCGIYKEDIAKLPIVKKMDSKKTIYSIPDSIEGWAYAIEQLFMGAFGGYDVEFDYGQIRAAGELVAGRFKAPGPKPLRTCIEKCKAILKRAANRHLTTFEVHRLVCLIGKSVISGGVRRSAIIVLCDPDDDSIVYCKGFHKPSTFGIESITLNDGEATIVYEGGDVEQTGLYQSNPEGWKEGPNSGCVPCDLWDELYMSNNSVCVPYGSDFSYDDIHRIITINKEIGDIGFVRVPNKDYGYNPCAEVLIQARIDGRTGFGFCNLVEINLEAIKTHDEFYKVCSLASFVATIQSLYTDFKFLDQASIDIARRDRAIGVGLTGICQSDIRGKVLERGARVVVETNVEWADKFGIEASKRSTVVKPSGNGTILLGGAASGIHPVHDKEYIRRVRTTEFSSDWQALKDTPLAKHEHGEYIISFPVKATGITKKNLGAIEFMKLIGEIKHFWVNKGVKIPGDHPNNVSATVELGPDEWTYIPALLYCNSHIYSGVSFLKRFDGFYPNLPYTRKDEAPEEYKVLSDYIKHIDIDFSKFGTEERAISDFAAMACAGGACEIQ